MIDCHRLSRLPVVFFAAALLLCACVSRAAGADLIMLDSSSHRYDVREFVEVLPDDGYGIEQVAGADFASKFVEPAPDFYPGEKPRGYWLRFRVQASSEQAESLWRVVMTPPQTMQLTIFYPEYEGGELVRWGRWDGGYYNPLRTSWKGEDFLAFRIPVRTAPTTYYIYYCAEDTNYNPLDLVDEFAYREQSRASLAFFAVVFGFSVALILYNLFLFVSLKDLSYLWYSLQSLSISAYYLIVNDTIIEFIDIPIDQYIVYNYLALSFFVFFSVLFVESFLTNIRSNPVVKKIYFVMRSYGVALVLASFVYGVDPMTNIYGFLLFGHSLLSIGLGIYSYKKGFSAARYYLLAWGILCAGLLLSPMNFLAFINTDVIVKLFQVLNMLEMLFFSLALADRISVFQRDRMVAEHLSEAKSAFLATMSHELRTPLNAISGMVRVVLQSDLTRDQRRNLSVVRTSADHLQRIISNILDFSRIEAGKLELECVDFDLRRVVGAVLDIARVEAAGKRLRFDVAIDDTLPGAVKGDPVRLRQVLLNLLGNAVKFTESGQVSLRVSRLEGGKVRFVVADTGIGIPPEMKRNVFTKFAQADISMTRKYGGTGLGLAICNQLVGLMGGVLALESEQGKGSTLAFDIPMEEGRIENAVKLEHPLKLMAASVRSLKLLVAEDNRNNVALMQAVFDQTPHEVRYVFDGKAALESVRDEEFDLVLMDLEMPEMSGLDVVRAIRSGGAGKAKTSLPVVALTAHAFDEIKAECQEAGMNGFVGKPFNVDDLLTVITTAVEGSAFIDVAADGDERVQELPVFDASSFHAMFGRDAAMGEKVKVSFLADLSGHLEALRVAAAAGEYEKLAERAHFMKTSAGVMSAGKLLLYAGRLEKAAKAGGDGVKDACAMVEDAAEELRRVLSR